jgi:hypothetical protein
VRQRCGILVTLVELLYPAVNHCYALEFNTTGSQEGMQQDGRASMISRHFQIQRPFYIVDAYQIGSQFLFIYLDEGVDDPIVRCALMYESDPAKQIQVISGSTLSETVNRATRMLLEGRSPF